METTVSIDLGQVARELNLPIDKIQRTLDLLDEGNTVPFITRYRKDQTGGLDEEQVRRVHSAVGKIRALAERKQTILKSIESQGKLTPELSEEILAARSPKHLEDLYLPFKPKKQTLATTARQRGLEPLANEVLEADAAAENLEARAGAFVSAENKLESTVDVLDGVRHIIAEIFSERADVRGRLRRIFQRSGRLVSSRIEPSKQAEGGDKQLELFAASEEGHETPAGESAGESMVAQDAPAAESLTAASDSAASEVSATTATIIDPIDDGGVDAEAENNYASADAEHADALEDTDEDGSEEELAQEDEAMASSDASEVEPAAESPTAADAPAVAAVVARTNSPLKAKLEAKRQARVAAREQKKKKKQKLLEIAFKDYYDYQEPLNRVPPHRVLAINRGERARVLRVKIEADLDAMGREAEELLFRAEHPHVEFLRSCLRDALTRLILPSLERELRREMTERAETHAVDVFVCNLRKLLLQPPVHGRRVLAMDPGFRSGCKLAVIDEFGNLIDHGMIHVIGSEQHLQMCRNKLVETINKQGVSVLAIGNGTACRETEQLVADVLGTELKDRDISYVIVNEAGASVYSTSPLGREELPKYDATVRGAVSIGRRLLDPLSELVKINAANIGVGLYQHDVKASHLRDSLDAVVESCVNYVGVDVNTASPALLRYVSGLNQLTARRLYEYRLQHGPFRNREQLKQVPGIGEATYVQAAGFLKISGGDHPLDATWIHPESYEIAEKVLEKLGSSVAELATTPTLAVEAAAPAVPSAFAEDVAPASPSVSDSAASVEATAEAPSATDNVPPTVEAATDEVATSSAGETVAEAQEVESPPPAAVVESGAVEPAGDAVPSGEAVAEEPSASALAAARREALAARVAQMDEQALLSELAIGALLLRDILAALARPARDPREDLPPPVFRRGIMKLEDLAPGMELSGTVLNVVDFGAFVDIGLSDSALVHISRLADRFVKDPHEVVGVGDVLKVWVVEVDKQRRRVSLTAIRPGSEKPQEQQQRPPRAQRPERPAARPAGQAAGPATSRPPANRAPSGNAPPPRSGGRPQGQYQGGDQGQAIKKKFKPPKYMTGQASQPPKKPKPVKPITKGMIEGKEPMRAFSDLLQFYKKKTDGDEETPPKNR